MPDESRLIVVTNRLPVGIKRSSDGTFEMTKSSGGLVSAMTGLKIPFIWIGWVGGDFPKEEHDGIRTRLWDEFKCVPVFIEKQTMEGYYDGYANSVLWPLFHYDTNVDFRWDWYEYYQKANEAFAEVLCRIYQPGDAVWVHDYHLFLLPRIFRDQVAALHSPAISHAVKIGWFLHIPFPSSEIFRTLPQATDLLQHLLACNVVGFHTYEYARHFQHCCARMLGVDVTSNTISYRRIAVTVGVHPIGIELEPFKERCHSDEVVALCERLRSTYGHDHTIIISVDRLDPIKGVPLKMEGMRQFFGRFGHRRGRVTLLQVAVPSREGVQSYVDLRSETERLVGEVNAQYGTIGHPNPVQYLFQSVSPASLTALYLVADVCLITSVRDGMNLVCQEWLTCHAEREAVIGAPPGVLILSEFVGAAHTLHGCLRVNPFDADAIADAIEAALSMSNAEKAQRFETQYKFVEKHDANAWGSRFVAAMEAAPSPPVRGTTAFTDVAAEWRAAGADGQQRLLVVRLDGVLVEDTRRASRVGAIAVARRTLRSLAASPNTTIVVVSWAGRAQLVEQYGDLNVWLAAECGLYVRAPWWDNFVETNSTVVAASAGWRPGVMTLFAGFADRTPGARVHGRIRVSRHGGISTSKDDDGGLSAVAAFDCTSAERLFSQQIVRELQMHVTQTYGADVHLDIPHPGLLIVRPVVLSVHALLHAVARLGGIPAAAVSVVAVNEPVDLLAAVSSGAVAPSPMGDPQRAPSTASAAARTLAGKDAVSDSSPAAASVAGAEPPSVSGTGPPQLRSSFGLRGSTCSAGGADASKRVVYVAAVGSSDQAVNWPHDVYFPSVEAFLTALQPAAVVAPPPADDDSSEGPTPPPFGETAPRP